jgi:hypothetical protein
MAAFQDRGVDGRTAPGINDDDPLAPQDARPGEPFMAALRGAAGLRAVFSGHDHGNDWCGRWDGGGGDDDDDDSAPFLCFGRHTGYGGYGRWTRGSRQVRLDERALARGIRTWNRLEDGSVSGAVVLNATYGEDRYPVVNNTETRQ